jgi:sugar transferase (PEP-CTERM/EpsH1 system associated)
MPMRIMHVVNNLGKGGLENGLVNLLHRLDPNRFEHVVCTVRGLGPNADRLPKDRVRVMALSAASVPPVQTPAFIRVIRTVRPDVVHSRNWGTIEAVFAARMARVPGVIHSEHGFEAAASAPEPWRRTLVRRAAYELADRVMSVSSQLRELHGSRTGFPSERITVIPNGVDTSRFFPDAGIRRSMRAALGIADAELCVGCVANLVPVKDHMTLLQSLAALDERHHRNWRLLLIGDGPERPRLESFVNGYDAWRSRVQFLGSSDRVPDLLRAMDAFVLPSLAEGMCNSLLEAMATGVAVVATDVGGNPEVVVDGDSGLLFAARDVRALGIQLEQLYEQPALRQRLGQRALERARGTFSIDAMVLSYDRLYSTFTRPTSVPVLSPGY